jgi:uncharacterized protein YacL (UPF0231 family)
MNSRKLESKIIAAAHLHDFQAIQEIYVEMSNAKIKMDRWFDKYLDMFDEKLAMCGRNDPVKKLYNTKFDEYSHITRVIRVAQSYMNQNSN